MANGLSMSISTRNKHSILLIIGALALLVQCSQPHTPTPPEIPINEIHSADIAFRLGRTLQSDAIASHGSSGYSHVGIIIASDSSKSVIHIEPNCKNERIKIESLEEFFHPDNAISGCIMRHKQVTDSLQLIISNHAKRLLNSPITFDHDYSLNDSSRMYCTELVEHLYNIANISLSQEKRIRLPLAKEPVIMPSAIYENDSLKPIWSYRLK